ncbi:DUF6876 family protein [Falsiroseomonas selenitidurans]|uniref:DUF6876 domain-containing protein n=1 Tax=Falsiroseomonas selenitidurans TaxID=2716335 RepID=A0ABX1E4Y9_9PROT|nr:DUF6876 family protein [Falsiroseomonas selenitidurans]NKC32046.1 hypothetical protein [Falsiroseomonas selenitidurans]
MDANTLRAQLAQFTGSDTFTHRQLLRRMIMTQGVIWLADQAQAHWLTDVIASYQHEPHISSEHFQTWRLNVDEITRTAVITMTDGNSDTPLVQQVIAYTDFCLDEITLWLIAQGDHLVLMLPSEY